MAATAAAVVALLVAAPVQPSALARDNTSSISGIISDARTGTPQGNACTFTIRAEVYNGPTPYRPPVTGCLDADGRYTISGLDPGSYLVLVDDSSGEFARTWYPSTTRAIDAQAVTVTSGTTSTADVAMIAGGWISGRLTHLSSGKPFADDCQVQVEAQGKVSTGCTGPDGSYTVRGLGAGHVHVRFTRPGYATQFWPHQAVFRGSRLVNVNNGQGTTGIDAALQTGGTLHGTLTLAATGEPVSNSCLTMLLLFTAKQPEPDVTYYQPPNNQSHFTFRHLLAGSYKVLAGFDPGSATDRRCYDDQWYDSRGDWNTATAITVRRNQVTNITVGLRKSQGG